MMSLISRFGVTSIVIILGWQLIVWITGVPRYILPGPLLVAQSFIDNLQLIFEHALITISEIISGLIIGVALGMATALYMMISASARQFLQPLMVFSQTVPVFALAPLLTLWLGYGVWSKIVMCVLIIYFPVASTFFDGLRNTPAGYLDLAKTMRAGSLPTLFKVRFPAALPALASGIKLAAVYAPIGAVISEWVGASQGLGYLMLLANGRVKIDLLFASLVALSLFTICLYLAISWLARRMTERANGLVTS